MSSNKKLSNNEYKAKVTLALEAQNSYYKGENPILDDAQYDEIIMELINYEKNNPTLIDPSSPVGKVGAPLIQGETIKHSQSMLSLDNVFSKDEFFAWGSKLAKVLNRKVVNYYVEPKLDGLAIAARYVEGNLTLVLTRGDGDQGEDVTAQARLGIVGLPKKLSENIDIEVRGEVLMTYKDFDEGNKKKLLKNEKPLANPRNAASGSLRALHEKDRTPLTFFAYQYLEFDGSYNDSIEKLKDLGFNTTFQTSVPPMIFSTLNDAYSYIEKIGELRASLDFGTDGAVVKANDLSDRLESGFTSRSPRWAIAYKYPSDMRMTTLLSIELQLGRTGAVTPVAKVSPVEVGGTTITSITLHNRDEIMRKDIRVGDMVWVRRAGEVIPEIMGVEFSKRISDLPIFDFPKTCPQCSQPLDQSMQVWRCINSLCSQLPALLYFTSRDCMDIEGLGEKHITNLYKERLVTTVADIYRLTYPQLLTIDRMGEKLALKILNQIENSKKLPLSRLLTGLGFSNIGRRASRKLASHFIDLSSLRKATLAELELVEGIGKLRGETLHKELRESSALLDELVTLGLNVREENVKLREGIYSNKSICITGSFEQYSRDELASVLEKEGAKIVSSISSKTDFLLLGTNPGSKLEKANSLGTKILSLDDLRPLLND